MHLFRATCLWMIGSTAMAATTTTTPTFYKDVLPILQKRCQECHRPGELAPMSLLSYQEARPWAKSIKSSVVSKKMPPWFADPRYGHFANERKLTDSEVTTLVAWVDAGSPEGDTKDKPAPVKSYDGWNIKPDVVIEMPKAVEIPAVGTVEYTYVIVPTGFTKDTWVTAAEVRPSNRAVVHHVIAFVRTPGALYLRDAKPGEPVIPNAGVMRDENGFPAQPSKRQHIAEIQRAENQDVGPEFLAGYAPGLQPQRFSIGGNDAAKLIPAGSDIVFQLHYAANGKATSDHTKIALTLAPAPPQHRFLTLNALNTQIDIPAGDSNYESHASVTLKQNADLVWLQPHMHLRGKDMTFKVTYPTGESEILLQVPHFSFSWQLGYEEAKPILLPKGSRIDVTAHHDNSMNNPDNPNPRLDVRWGDQSWEEMMIGWMGLVVNADANPKAILSRPPRQSE
ncbi:MAG: thiol-disulfide isomerase [Bryobacteraceae bacterium]